MREIKFRAWELSKQAFTNSYTFDVNNGEIIEWIDFLEYIECERDKKDDLIFLQYTGLKDKNGVEIYEGDIVNLGDKSHNFTIEYKLSSFVLIHKDRKELCGLNIPYKNKDLEVIGNIYENKDLLDD